MSTREEAVQGSHSVVELEQHVVRLDSALHTALTERDAALTRVEQLETAIAAVFEHDDSESRELDLHDYLGEVGSSYVRDPDVRAELIKDVLEVFQERLRDVGLWPVGSGRQ